MTRVLIVFLLFGIYLSAEEKPVYHGTAQVSFFASSTFHDFSGRGSTKSFDVYLSPDKESWKIAAMTCEGITVKFTVICPKILEVAFLMSNRAYV